MAANGLEAELVELEEDIQMLLKRQAEEGQMLAGFTVLYSTIQSVNILSVTGYCVQRLQL